MPFRLRNRGARQQLHLRIACQQIQMFRLASRQQVQIEIVAQHGGGCHRVFRVLAVQLREPVKRSGVDHRPLFNPADLVLGGLHLEKPPPVFQHFERLAVHHLAHAIRDGGHAVAQVHLAHAHIDRVVMLVAKARTARGERNHAHHQQR
jgi:hypothetical protein